MKFSALHTLTAGIALSLSMTACGTAEEGTDDLGAALDQLEAQAEQAALREHGVDQEDQDAAAADEEAGAELGDEADEAPRPGERIGDFCNERSAEVLARCEARLAEGGELPEQAESCDDVADHARRECVRRAVRHVRHRMEEHNDGGCDEARGIARAREA